MVSNPHRAGTLQFVLNSRTASINCVIELWGWVSSDLAPHIETVYSAISTPTPTPTPAELGIGADDPQKSWWWQFSTGPALGGVLALVAAGLAFWRVGHQIQESARGNAETARGNAETARGNTETARKNVEERWWDTLKWTYTEAKESEATGGAFQAVAAVRILDSLNQDRDKLTVQQQRAVESILDIFGQSNTPEVQDAVAPIYTSMGRQSPHDYENAVGTMLLELESGVRIVRQNGGMDRGVDFDLRRGKNLLLIQTKSGGRSVGPKVVKGLHDAIEGSKDPKNTAGLLITDALVSPVALKALHDANHRAAVVQWEPGMPTDDVEMHLNLLSRDAPRSFG